MLKADMHIHTYFSDGFFPPEKMIEAGVQNGVKLFSVTDHDNCLAYPRVVKSCESAEVKCVRGIEVSAYVGKVKVHTLGYAFNAESEVYKKFAEKLRSGSLERLADVIKKLKACGREISEADVLGKLQNKYCPVHSMHIAQAGADKYGGNRFEFYSSYLAVGRVAHSNICRPSPEEAIEVMRLSGGKAVIAHPARIELDRESVKKLIERLKDCGLYGIECVHKSHTVSDTAYFKELAKTLGLAVTGGSDNHTLAHGTVGEPAFYADGIARDFGIET